jgi:AcrR family transcriptional regulator
MSSKVDDITRAGLRVFPRCGYSGTTVDQILREAKVARSTFYVYFPNKRELFKHIVEEINTVVLGKVTAAVDDIMESFSVPQEEWPSRDALRQAFVDLMKSVFGYISVNDGMTLMFTVEIPRVDDELTRVFFDFQRGMKEQFVRIISFGREIGVVRTVDERLSAEFIVGGLFHLAASVVAGEILYDLDDISRQFVDLHLSGLLREGALADRE